MTLSQRIHEHLLGIYDRLVERRRDFHRHPEIGFHEVRTSKIVAEWLSELDIPYRSGVGKTGVVGRIQGRRGSGPVAALRADMDALPIQDAKDACEYRSTHDGFMHACGHDAHTTMLLGAAAALQSARDDFAGEVVLLFQPAEEGLGGAEAMIDAGAIDDVDVILGQHVSPSLPSGFFGVTTGPAMANVDFFTVQLKGRGGHGAYPHLTVDSVAMAGQTITALQNIVSRMADPLESVVVTIGTVNGGYRDNVIADVVELTGTVRTFNDITRAWVPKQMDRIIAGIASAFGGTYEFAYRNDTVAVVNPEREAERMKGVAQRVLGEQHVMDLPPVMGGEDFAFYLRKIPGCFWWLGARHPKPLVEGYGLHHPSFDLDESALVHGARLLSEGALEFLNH